MRVKTVMVKREYRRKKKDKIEGRGSKSHVKQIPKLNGDENENVLKCFKDCKAVAHITASGQIECLLRLSHIA